MPAVPARVGSEPRVRLPMAWRFVGRRRQGESGSLLERLRLLCLALALGTVVQTVPLVLRSGSPLSVRLLAVGLTFALAGYWVWGFRRGGFPVAGEAGEILAVYVVLLVASGNPLLPLFGLALHSLYGRAARAWARYGLWMAAVLAAHASRGAVQLSGDLARVLATAMVPGFLQLLLSSTEGLERSEHRLASLVRNSSDVLTVVDREGRIRWQAQSIRAVLGIDPASVIGLPFENLVHRDDQPKLDAYFEEAHDRVGLSQTLALRLRSDDGGWREFEVVIADRLGDPSVGGFVLNMRDATARLRLERDLQALAAERERDSLRDGLTGLPNRRSLLGTLARSIATADKDRARFALLLIDLDRFKDLNDTLGHQVGDQLLKEIGPRLRGSDRELEVVARLGGDEFAVLVCMEGPEESAENVAELLLEAIGRPFMLNGVSLLVEASVGIAVYPDHAGDSDALLPRAEIAMYAAKRTQSGHAFYDARVDERSRERLTLLGELPRALAAGELLLHYQPKFELKTGEICGVEALIRWEHPTRGLLYPDAFLAAVEKTGLMRALTLYVLDEALKQCATWRHEGLSLPVAVNISVANLLDAALPDDVERLLRRWDLDPGFLQLEITERVIANDVVGLGEMLARVRDRGVQLSLDDFGTGSSSLSYLRQLPVQELKIDKSFVLALPDGEQRDAAVVRTIIALARDLGLRSVAEGIETDTIHQLLKAWGCDQGQGYGLARPMPADGVTELIHSHNRGSNLIPSARNGIGVDDTEGGRFAHS